MRILKHALIFLCFAPLAFNQLGAAFAQSLSPKDVVKLFLEVYGTERMAEILPYTSPAFREDLPPGVWLERTSTVLHRLDYIRLGGSIESVKVNGDMATVMVLSRVSTKAAKISQTEIYSLRRTAKGWKLLDLRVVDEVLIELYRTETG